jgi:hypothetical protein
MRDRLCPRQRPAGTVNDASSVDAPKKVN